MSTQGQPLQWLVKYSPPTHHEGPQWAKWWDCQRARQISTSCAHSSLLDLEQWLHQVLLQTASGMAHILAYISILKLLYIFISRIHFFCPLSCSFFMDTTKTSASAAAATPYLPIQVWQHPAAAFLHYIPLSSIRIVNNGEFLELDALFFQQVYTKLQTQKSLIVAAVGNLLARRRRKGTGGGEDNDWKDNSNIRTKGYIGIFYVFFHIFGDFLEVRYICPPARANFFMLGTPSTQIWGKNSKKSSTRGAQGPPFFSIIPRSVLSGVLPANTAGSRVPLYIIVVEDGEQRSELQTQAASLRLYC